MTECPYLKLCYPTRPDVAMDHCKDENIFPYTKHANCGFYKDWQKSMSSTE